MPIDAFETNKQAALKALGSGDLGTYLLTLEAGARALVRERDYDTAAEYLMQWVFIIYAAPRFGSFFHDIENVGKQAPPWHISGGPGDRKLPGKIVNLLREIPDFEKRLSAKLAEHQELLSRAFHCPPPRFDIMFQVLADCEDFDDFKRRRDQKG